jgi:hypothetical protein
MYFSDGLELLEDFSFDFEEGFLESTREKYYISKYCIKSLARLYLRSLICAIVPKRLNLLTY